MPERPPSDEGGVDVAVVVPTYRRVEQLTRLIEALAVQDDPHLAWEIVVVDDCSGPTASAALDGLAARSAVPLRVLSTPANSGPAVARNLGWRATAAPVVAFLDDDVVPARSWLEHIVEPFDADPGTGLVQGLTRPPEGIDVRDLALWSLWRDVPGPAAGPYFESCNIAYRREALEQAKGFDEDIGWWGEDSALGWKVLEAGWRRRFAKEAVVVHDVEWRGPGWFIRNGWREKNLVLLAARHPGYRAEAFWRPWAYRKRDAAFVAAAASALMGLRWRPALVGLLPYLWLGRPPVRKPQFLLHCLETLAVDAARSAGHLAGSLQHRVAIL